MDTEDTVTSEPARINYRTHWFKDATHTVYSTAPMQNKLTTILQGSGYQRSLSSPKGSGNSLVCSASTERLIYLDSQLRNNLNGSMPSQLSTNPVNLKTAVPSLLEIPQYRERFLSRRCCNENERSCRWLRSCVRGKYIDITFYDLLGAADNIIYKNK